MSARPKPRRRWAVVGLVALVILAASIGPPPGTGRLAVGPFGLVPIDKWAHGIAYGGLAGAIARAMAPSARSSRRIVLFAVVLAVAYGAAIEVLQLGLPGRQFGVGDLAANAVGAIVGGLGWRGVVSRRGRHARDRS